MKRHLAAKYVFCLCIALFLVSCLIAGDLFCLELKSSAFEGGAEIPDRYTGAGEDVSPPLSWSDVPDGTRSFILTMDDPDAPMGTWIHWVVYNIPGTSTSLKEDLPRKMLLSDGTKQGINSFRWFGYGGPHPPPGRAHTYVLTLYALDTVPDVISGANKGTVIRAAQGHVLDSAQLTGTFGR